MIEVIQPLWYLGMSGDVIVDHAVNVRDIESTRCHISGQQHGAGLRLEFVQSSQTLILVSTTREKYHNW